MQIKETLQWGYEKLMLLSDSARLDAEILLAHVLSKPATFLLANDDKNIGLKSLERYKELIEKREKGIPVAYLTNHKEFFFLDFFVDENVLIPRPDTEILVESVIGYLNKLRNSIFDFKFSKFLLLDVGTGSGCIPISVLKNVDGITAIAADISKNALKVATKNVRKHMLESRVRLAQSNLLKNIPDDFINGRKVILTANLPYIPNGFKVNRELKYEPSISLYGGDDGLDVYNKLMQEIRGIKPVAMFLELFDSQIPAIETKLTDYRIKNIQDMSGKARLLVLEKI